MGVNVIVVLNIVLMIGRGNKQRIKINNLNTQILQIVHLVHNTLQVAAVKISDVHCRRITVPVVHMLHFLIDVLVLVVLDIIGGVAVAETVHINLVHYRTLRPLRRLEAGNDNEVIIVVAVLMQTASGIVITHNPADIDFKTVGQFFVFKLHFNAVKIEALIRPFLGHENSFTSADKKDTVNIIFCRTETDGYQIVRAGLRGSHIVLSGIAEQRFFVQYRPHGCNIQLILFFTSKLIKIHKIPSNFL